MNPPQTLAAYYWCVEPVGAARADVQADVYLVSLRVTTATDHCLREGWGRDGWRETGWYRERNRAFHPSYRQQGKKRGETNRNRKIRKEGKKKRWMDRGANDYKWGKRKQKQQG